MLDSVHRNAKGQQHLAAMAVNVVAFDNISQMGDKHLMRHRAVVIEGKLSLFNTTDKCGQNKGFIEITASKISVVENKAARR